MSSLGNSAPRSWWQIENFDGGPDKSRRRLYVAGPGSSTYAETPFFVVAHRYACSKVNGKPATLLGAGMDTSGCAARLRHGRIADLQHVAEQMAMRAFD